MITPEPNVMQNRRITLLALFVSALTLATPTLAQEPNLKQLDWMSGRWVSQGQEEHWSKPHSASMLGYHRDTKDGKTIFFEFLRIEESSKGIIYWASPSGGPAVPFYLSSMGKHRVTFSNPDHDFPKEIHYSRRRNKLRARISDGKSKHSEWEWKRKR